MFLSGKTGAESSGSSGSSDSAPSSEFIKKKLFINYTVKSPFKQLEIMCHTFETTYSRESVAFS